MQVSYSSDTYVTGKVDVEYGERSINNYVDFQQRNNKMDLFYSLRTPKFADQETLKTNFTYKRSASHHNVT